MRRAAPAPTPKESRAFDIRRVWGDDAAATARRNTVQNELATWAENSTIWDDTEAKPQEVYSKLIQKIVETLKAHAACCRAVG